MSPRRRRRPTRWLAPLAILAVAGAAYGIVDAQRSDSKNSSTTTTRSTATTRTTTTTKKKPVKRTYVVRSGDTLSAISITTGVPVSTIRDLNPDVDVQALQPGEKLKLRR